MYELDECMKLTKKIVDITYDIEELEAKVSSPKNQVITGMPRGGGAGNPIEYSISKLESLKSKRKSYEDKRSMMWNNALSIFDKCNIEEENITLFKLRYCDGKKWGQCVKKLCKLYPQSKWNSNKCFRVHRNVLNIIDEIVAIDEKVL